MTTATLECIEFWDKETRTLPKFRLTYTVNGETKTWEFRAVSRGEASSEVRWFLDALIFGKGDSKWYPGMDEKRIKYAWVN